MTREEFPPRPVHHLLRWRVVPLANLLLLQRAHAVDRIFGEDWRTRAVEQQRKGILQPAANEATTHHRHLDAGGGVIAGAEKIELLGYLALVACLGSAKEQLLREMRDAGYGRALVSCPGAKQQ